MTSFRPFRNSGVTKATMAFEPDPDRTSFFSHKVNRPSAQDHVNREQFLNGMRRFAGAVHVITVRLDGVSYGLTATSVCSLSADPPRLLACVNMKGATFGAIRQRGAFVVNTLAAGQENIAVRFSREGDADADRFEAGTWQHAGAMALPNLEGASCRFECALCEAIDSGTHALLIADIVHVSLGQPAAPLIYHDGMFCGLLAH